MRDPGRRWTVVVPFSLVDRLRRKALLHSFQHLSVLWIMLHDISSQHGITDPMEFSLLWKLSFTNPDRGRGVGRGISLFMRWGERGDPLSPPFLDGAGDAQLGHKWRLTCRHWFDMTGVTGAAMALLLLNELVQSLGKGLDQFGWRFF
jgi:hypothetical protein